jgi:hypothetical protein
VSSKVFLVNVTSSEGDERRIMVSAPNRSVAFEMARVEYRELTGRAGIQLSIVTV